MIDYAEIAQALVDYGYVEDTDLTAAVELLADALVVDEDERDEAILEAEAAADIAVAADDVATETLYQVEVHDDVMNVAADAEILAGGDANFGIAFARATDALLAADLIDEANSNAVKSLITEFWIEDDD